MFCSSALVSISGCANFIAFSTKMDVTMFQAARAKKPMYAMNAQGTKLSLCQRRSRLVPQSCPPVVHSIKESIADLTEPNSSRMAASVTWSKRLSGSRRSCAKPWTMSKAKTYTTKRIISEHQTRLMKEPSTQSNIKRISVKNRTVRKTRSTLVSLKRRKERMKLTLTPADTSPKMTASTMDSKTSIRSSQFHSQSGPSRKKPRCTMSLRVNSTA
mmetsp:Transcript_22155/g.63531  ORF Transcript_22155/g.63531 Transcript_22155/m.63531 type:complete len:215 (-) Transcript_22155:708-1352(-)